MDLPLFAFSLFFFDEPKEGGKRSNSNVKMLKIVGKGFITYCMFRPSDATTSGQRKKIKAISLLKFSGLTVKDIDKALLKRSGSSTIECDAAKLHGELLFNVVPEDSDSAIIYYISGYCARFLVWTNKCTSCKESLVLDINSHVQLEGDNEVAAFLIEASRGGLWEPQQHYFS